MAPQHTPAYTKFKLDVKVTQKALERRTTANHDMLMRDSTEPEPSRQAAITPDFSIAKNLTIITAFPNIGSAGR